jgi:sugar phosphate isomerase/epimerase
MDISICSYSFHRTLAAGKQDIYQYIDDCKALGVSHLEPWIAHFGTGRKSTPSLENIPQDKIWDTFRALMKQPPPVLAPGTDPASVEDGDYLDRVKAAAEAAGLAFGGIAVDGAHIYEPSPEARQANRQLAYRWLDVAEKLGATQMRIDSGGPEDLPDDVFKIIVEGYEDLISKAQPKGVEIIIENHWGASKIPANVVKMLEAIDGLGLLLDTNNWAEGLREEGWRRCAKYATALHIKTFEFDEHGNDPTVDLSEAIRLLRDNGYNGIWGIESVPRNGDEYEGARRTIDLIERELSRA